MIKYTDICLDLETTGLNSQTSNIIQLAAVKFNLNSPHELTNVFDKCLLPLPNRGWSESTKLFWAKQPAGLLQGLIARAEHAPLVMNSFLDWLYDGSLEDVCQVRVWAKPITTEWAFLRSYFDQLGLINPFSHRKTRDVYSFLEGYALTKNIPMPEMKEFEYSTQTKHDALSDTVSTIEYLWKAVDKINKTGIISGVTTTLGQLT